MCAHSRPDTDLTSEAAALHAAKSAHMLFSRLSFYRSELLGGLWVPSGVNLKENLI